MYFAALLARTEDGWEASDTELDDVESLSDLAELAREASPEDDTVLVLIEQEDAWFGVVRIDGEDDPRIYVSDAAAAARLGEWRLTGCTLVVTLEPCTMCAGAIVQSRVDRVVYGARDEKAGAAGSLWDVVRDRRLNHRPEVVSGVRADESTILLDDFFASQRRRAQP